MLYYPDFDDLIGLTLKLSYILYQNGLNHDEL